MKRIGRWLEARVDDLFAVIMIGVFCLVGVMIVAGIIGNYFMK